MPIVNLVVLAVLIVVPAILLAPRLLQARASRAGVEGVGVVVSAKASAVMDEYRRHFREVELDVVVPGQPTFRTTVRQHLPWYVGDGPSPGTRLVVRVLMATRSVAIIGPERGGASHGGVVS